MDGLIKRIVTTMALCLTTLFMYAQEWTAKDSLRLKKLFDGDLELNLNPDVVKSIDFGSAARNPRMSKDKSWMHFDESLPQVLPKPKVVLTLMPYTATTPYDWDPIYQKKIRVNKNTWRGDPFYELRHLMSSTNGTNIRLGKSGVYINGGAIGGLDLMAMFTRDFWSKKRLETRDRTLKVLSTYGDSTTVLINAPIEQIAR